MSFVDVLAVMDTDARAVALYADTCSEAGLRKHQWLSHLKIHDEARAAVAELIESNLEFDAAHLAWDTAPGFALSIGDVDGRDFDGPEYARLYKAIERRESALDRVTGVAE